MENPHTQNLNGSLGRLHAFADLVEKMLKAEASALDERIAAAASKFPTEEEQVEFFESHGEDFFELSDDLPSILRYSVLIRADSALEQYLTRTSESFASVNNCSVQLKDFAGRGFPRVQQYLKKVAGVQFPDTVPEWQTVLRLHELRNCIVHADGYVEENHAALNKWIDATPGIKVSAGRIVTLEAKFSAFAIESYIRFSEIFDPCCKSLGLWLEVFPVIKS